MGIPARTAVLLLWITLLALSATYAVASSQSGDGRFDTDGDGLIGIEFLEQLDAIRHDLDGDGIADDDSGIEAYGAAFPGMVCNNCNGYELVRPLDFNGADSYASGAINAGWTVGAGWRPVGPGRRPFVATFDGNENAISNLYITAAARADSASVGSGGLFGSVGVSGVIRNTGLLNVNVAGGDAVGPLAGANQGTVSRSYATGSVSGYGAVGGLVGINASGAIISSYAAVSVSGAKYIGGLAGSNSGTVIASYAAGSVTGDGRFGELAGYQVGGLAGNNRGSIIASYSTGAVRGQQYVGGLIGLNEDGSISASYSESEVTGGQYIGGLAGRNEGIVGLSYVVGKVSSDGSIDAPLEHIGGLVGYNAGTINSGLWDIQSSGQQVGIGIEAGDGLSSDIFGKTTAELQSPAGYTGPYRGWDVSLFIEGAENTPDHSLSDFWDFGTSGQYPALKVDFDGDGTATWQEFGSQRGDAPGPTPAPMVDNCVEIMTVAAISGVWRNDCASGRRPGSYARFYTFTVDERSNVTIVLESEITDNYLSLLQGPGRTGRELESYSSISRTSRINQRLGAGIYTVEATTNLAAQTGSFTLTINGLATPPPSPAPTVTATPPPTPTVGPTSTPALVPTPARTLVPIPARTLVPIPAGILVPTPARTLVPTPARTLVLIETPTLATNPAPALVEPTDLPGPTEMAAQEPTPDPEPGSACSFAAGRHGQGAAAISMFLLVAPLAMVGSLKVRACRRRAGWGEPVHEAHSKAAKRPPMPT